LEVKFGGKTQIKTLVTGCAGFIGSHLTERLLREGYEVIGIDCFTDHPLPITDHPLPITDHPLPITDHVLRFTDHTLPIADRDRSESPVKEMVKEFGVEAYGYDPLLSKEEIKGFGVNALDELDVKIKMDGVIVAVAHDEFKKMKFKDFLFARYLEFGRCQKYL